MDFVKEIYPLTDFVTKEEIKETDTVTYYYEGICPKTGDNLRLPRTILAEKVALSLCRQLKKTSFQTVKGKMLGVLIVKDSFGKLAVIKAFSGLLNGKKQVDGWVSQISGDSMIALAENLTLKQLDDIKQEILTLESLPLRHDYQQISPEYQRQYKNLKVIHRQRKEIRDKNRFFYKNISKTPELVFGIVSLFCLSLSQRRKDAKFFYYLLLEFDLSFQLYRLQQDSRRDDWERRILKRQWEEKLLPLEIEINQTNEKIQQLKQQRKKLSQQLQAQMQTAYTLTNFSGDSLSIGSLLGKAFIPTGTGDCCTPKLLHYASTNHLQPVAMAEFWWGESSPNGERVEGHFYPACVDRCQPLMGFLLSGLPTFRAVNREESIPVIYEDEWVLVVDKPSGLLSVSGRGSHNFESVESRFRQITTAKSNFQFTTVHRLDQDTSGILILAKTQDTYINLSQQFAQRQVKKIYEAILNGVVSTPEGIINLPLWSNPLTRPRQEVNYLHGKSSITHFQMMKLENGETRLQLKPVTGRTHQLRVHCLQGLGFPIKGDRLYGNSQDNNIRLHLHAREITFIHPHTQQSLHLKTITPF
ncbi:RluA family pseudouridine synthase [Geminocystis sp. NIES-3709]|uniref:RluA family pseudouridine synthase n=1 Tax=Geminocystis sp. NIES-3709 TaxID=1617448 RepID=UPI0005FC3D03|nr:RluA family pseudouridine synthase [Geminocystis sp. NIES-3709]BAQ66255.1 ribosomal large subunit pseudouridine synthase A [Geminocystis sp. NIES-3709]